MTDATGRAIKGLTQHDFTLLEDDRPQPITTFAGGDFPAAVALAIDRSFSMKGTPVIYYGDEIAMEGGDEPTTRGDFPGGFRGDKRDAFSAGGRTKDEQELFEYIRRLTTLRRELAPLRTGALVNLYVSEQQYAYARTTPRSTVVVVFNNDDKNAEIEFDVTRAGLKNGARLTDRLGTSRHGTRHDTKKPPRPEPRRFWKKSWAPIRKRDPRRAARLPAPHPKERQPYGAAGRSRRGPGVARDYRGGCSRGRCRPGVRGGRRCGGRDNTASDGAAHPRAVAGAERQRISLICGRSFE